MGQPLPRLRMNLDFIPSPVEDRPGLLIRDSQGYSDAILIVPPPLVECLNCFDGEQTELDLRAALTRITGELETSGLRDHLIGILSSSGFLHDETYEGLKEAKRREFIQSPVRNPSHAGTAYPADTIDLKRTMSEYMTGAEMSAGDGKLIAIAAPHVSPFGGWRTYQSAYSALGATDRERVFVILGTSHYGDPDKFGLTRKPFVTPFGTAQPELSLIDELARERAACMEDYCHSIEHSIEFQVIFLQHLFGPEIRIVPVLCGSYARSILRGGMPEDNPDVERFLGRLGEISGREGNRLLWVLGIDMAHMGVRYGDAFEAEAGRGPMEEVEQRDRERIRCIERADARGFWERVQEGQDDLKWCGSAPVYTFLKAVPNARGTLRAYEQWNIDEHSVVSFGALQFRSD